MKMGWLRNSLLTGLTLLTLSCTSSKPSRTIIEYPISYAGAVVDSLQYLPERTGSVSGIGVTIGLDGSVGAGAGGGKIKFSELHTILLRNNYGRFVIPEQSDFKPLWLMDLEQNDPLRVPINNIWSKLNQGDTVVISWRTTFECVYSDTNGDGSDELISRTPVGSYLLDINKRRDSDSINIF